LCKRRTIRRIEKVFAESEKTVLEKAFVKRLKSLIVNSVHEDVSTFTERTLKNVTSALQNFHATLYTAFDKRSESIQNPTALCKCSYKV